jgi:REP element-mobilizing transposase RayT
MVVRKRLKIAGPALVFVTTTVKDWIPIFGVKAAADCIVSQLKDTLNYHQISMVGYVLMPSHLHILIGLKDLTRLSEFMESFKSLSSRLIKRLDLDILKANDNTSSSFQLWMPRFDDIVIVSEKQFRVKLDYMHNNPVKAGFVARAVDWEYSSAGDWLEGKAGFIPIDKDYKWTK